MSVSVMLLNPNVVNTLRKDLRQLGEDFASTNRLRKPFERIRDEVIIPSIDENFAVGGRPAWEPIDAATFMRRKSSGGNVESFIASGGVGVATALTDTGQLHKTAIAKARFIIRENTMEYGSWPERRWFGPVHNLPALSARAKIPNRPFTMYQKEDIEGIQRIMMEWIEERVNSRLRRRYV